MKRVFVEVLPREIDTSGLVVLVDILRATSTIVAALASGAEVVRAVATVEEALSWRQRGYLVAGERGGLPPEGFDLGNSPLEAQRLAKGRALVLTTTNGTQAVGKIRSASKVVAGAFLNLSAVIQMARGFNEVVVLCAGTEGRFSREDFLFASLLVQELSDYQAGDDATLVARGWAAGIGHLEEALRRSHHAQRLIKLGLEADVVFCARRDLFPVVPVLTGEGFKILP